MKRFLSTLFFLLLLSCQSDDKLNGDWILAYERVEEIKTNHSFLVSIDDSKWHMLEWNRPGYHGFKSVKHSFDFNIKNDSIYLERYDENPLQLVTIDQDSMVLQASEAIQNTTWVFKRLPKPTGLTTWRPAKKSYRFIGNKGLAYFDFINDTPMLEYNSANPTFKPKHWAIENFSNRSLLILNQLDYPQPIIIDSILDGKVHISTMDFTTNQYTLDEIVVDSTTINTLLGKWVLEDTKEKVTPIAPPPLLPGFTDLPIQEMQITEDSIQMNDRLNTHSHKWLLSGSQKNIIFPNTSYREWGSWRIIEMGKDRLVLDMPKTKLWDKGVHFEENREIKVFIKFKR